MHYSWSTSKDLKIVIMNMFKIFKDNMDKYIDEIYKNINSSMK